jgi:hypothetical protein
MLEIDDKNPAIPIVFIPRLYGQVSDHLGVFEPGLGLGVRVRVRVKVRARVTVRVRLFRCRRTHHSYREPPQPPVGAG